jgi:uncharacterized protein YqgQ
MNSLIVGGGEIGNSLWNILSNHYTTTIYDIKEPNLDLKTVLMWAKDNPYEVMHICFPYSDKFISEVKKYKKLFKPKYVVIHSTVPVGTNKKLNSISSPVIGIHPHLAESLKTFTKFLGGKDATDVADYFRRAGIKVYLCDNPETTELMKIQCTTIYAMNIEFFKDMKEQCKKYKVPFEAWTIWNDNYNKGYEELGYPEYHRYNLVPIMKRQGGHCTLNNLKLLKTKFTEFLKSL